MQTETSLEHARRQALTKKHRSVDNDINRRRRNCKVQHGGGLTMTHLIKSGGRTKRSEIREIFAEVFEAIEQGFNLSPKTIVRLIHS